MRVERTVVNAQAALLNVFAKCRMADLTACGSYRVRDRVWVDSFNSTISTTSCTGSKPSKADDASSN
jgi:hypothetical protein